MNIGTAKPTEGELSLAPHYFINNLSIQEDYSVGQYEREVLSKLKDIFISHDVAILVGGTGLYINAILYGLDQFPGVDIAIKRKYNQMLRAEGIHSLQSLISEKDPEYAETIDMNNPHRLIRALGVIEVSGKKFSSFLNQEKENRLFVPIKIALTMDRHLLYDRINKRVDYMVENGLVEEAKSLYKYKGINALNTVGYSEIFDHLDAKCFISESIEKIKQNTRNYAKRQSTWFRNQGEWEYFQHDKLERIEEFIAHNLTQ